jgi:hypothetical protein
LPSLPPSRHRPARTFAADREQDAFGQPGFIRSRLRGKNISVHAEAAFCIYLMLVLKSNRKKLLLVKPGVIENRRRSDKGKSQIPEYHRVTMDPDWAPGPAKA